MGCASSKAHLRQKKNTTNLFSDNAVELYPDTVWRTDLPEHHSDKVTCVAIFPSANFVVTASYDGKAAIRDLLWRDGKPGKIRWLKGHEDAIMCMAVFRKEDRIVTGSDDCTAIIWDVDRGEQRCVLEGHKDWIRGVAVSPGGDKVATASFDSFAIIWDADTGEKLRDIPYPAAVTCIAVFPESETHKVAIKRSLSKKHVDTADIPEEEVLPEFYFVTGSGNPANRVRIMDGETGRQVCSLGGHKHMITCVAVCSSGKRVVSCGLDRKAIVWSLVHEGHWRNLYEFQHVYPVCQVATFPKDNLLLSVSRDGEKDSHGNFIIGTKSILKLICTAESGSKSSELTTTTERVVSVAVFPCDHRVLIGRANGTASVRRLHIEPAHEHGHSHMEGALSHLHVHHAEGGAHDTGHTGKILDVAFFPETSRVLTGGADGRAIIWNYHTGHKEYLVPPPSEDNKAAEGAPDDIAHKDGVICLAVFSNEHRVITAGADRKVYIWQAPESHKIHMGRPGIHMTHHHGGDEHVHEHKWKASVELGPNTSTIKAVCIYQMPAETAVLTGMGHGLLFCVWDPNSGDKLLQVTGDSLLTAMVILHNGDLLIGGEGNSASVWNWKLKRQVHSLEGHKGVVTCAATFHKAMNIITGSKDQSAIVHSSPKLHLHGGHTAELTAVAVFPDDLKVITCSLDKTCVVWSSNPEDKPGTKLHCFRGHEDRGSIITSAAICSKGKMVLIAGHQGLLWLDQQTGCRWLPNYFHI